MFNVRKSREQLIQDGYEATLAEKERILQLLVEQVEYLRAQLHMPTNTVSMAAQPVRPSDLVFPEDGLPPSVRLQMADDDALTDEEEELLAMKQAGVISL